MGIVVESATQKQEETSNPQEKEVETPEENAEENSASESSEQDDESKEEAGTSEEDSEQEDENEESDSESEDDSETEEKTEQENGKKRKNRRNAERRIKQLARQRREAEREAEYWKSKALNNKEVEKPEPVKQETTSNDGRPNPDDFEEHDDYILALSDWRWKQNEEKKAASIKQNQQKSEFDQKIENHQKRVQEFASKTPDYRDVIEDVQDVRLSVAVEDVVLNSENGVELLYNLAKDPDELERICSLEPTKAYMELGKFQAGLKTSQNPPKTRKKVKTGAPKPLESPSNGSTSGRKKSIYDPGLTQKEYEELRRSQQQRG